MHTVVIIGSGFGGQCAAINLRQRGIEDFVILERRDFMGGTWAQNSYPGAAVDVQSPLYSIESEPYDWSQMFAEQEELREYTEHVISKHRLREKTRTRTEVKCIAWQQASQCWQIDTLHPEHGEQQLEARFVINASGPLSTPVIPDFKGRERFKGESFHTNHWNHDFDYRGKRVAIIGSGASAAQVIPAIAADVEHLHVFQRTPHWVIPRPDYRFKPWQRALLKRKPIYRLLREAIYWGLESRVIGFKYSKFMLELLAGKRARKHIEKQIADPKLRQQVTPDFTIGCKRVILSDTLYPALCRDNVFLHDKTDGIEEITAAGIHTQQGSELELDLIIYSTGYDATDGVISYPVMGRDGQKLADVWHDYPRAYLGTCVPGFPNLFIVTGPNTGIGHTSAIFIIEAQMNYIMTAIEQVGRRFKSVIEVRPEAEERYTQHIHNEMEKTVWHQGGCNSWYKSKSGKVIAMFPGFSFTFRRWTKNFRPADHILS
ncbi:Baeyer-Villiger monooxygenase [Bacterioplanes sanyensis]|uniref:flavin-containing monooxygenase n=1 Tax=Bacterioplanes sanyensis TaxID=1249553 RepID=UPI001672B58D|nr:NAD(P)/FAD-dependent oxidoreductase [Bacterioplanes sanyensis]GGY36262.1 Baeyer-Villiger monooxygenase [Bacterioplanes sanyensis]